MPGWLLSILEQIGLVLLKWALRVLEANNPGLRSVIEAILAYIGGSDDKSQAIQKMNDHVCNLK